MEQPIYLHIIPQINEADDPRISGKSSATAAGDMGPGGIINRYDWRVWSATGFGQMLSRSLSWGYGYSYEVTDMGRFVSVRAEYHSTATGKSVSKTFIITFDSPKSGDGTIFATSTKWRTFSNVSQAANYINSTIRSLAGRAS